MATAAGASAAGAEASGAFLPNALASLPTDATATTVLRWLVLVLTQTGRRRKGGVCALSSPPLPRPPRRCSSLTLFSPPRP